MSTASTPSIVAEVTSIEGGGVRQLGVVFEGGRPDVGWFAERRVLHAKDIDDGTVCVRISVRGTENAATFPVGDGADGLADATGEHFCVVGPCKILFGGRCLTTGTPLGVPNDGIHQVPVGTFFPVLKTIGQPALDVLSPRYSRLLLQNDRNENHQFSELQWQFWAARSRAVTHERNLLPILHCGTEYRTGEMRATCRQYFWKIQSSSMLSSNWEPSLSWMWSPKTLSRSLPASVST
jgi:hypothetical protein